MPGHNASTFSSERRFLGTSVSGISGTEALRLFGESRDCGFRAEASGFRLRVVVCFSLSFLGLGSRSSQLGRFRLKLKPWGHEVEGSEPAQTWAKESLSWRA